METDKIVLLDFRNSKVVIYDNVPKTIAENNDWEDIVQKLWYDSDTQIIIWDITIEKGDIEKDYSPRLCEKCWNGMNEGFVVDGCETYCSYKCMWISKEQFEKQYTDDGDTYWTEWDITS